MKRLLVTGLGGFVGRVLKQCVDDARGLGVEICNPTEPLELLDLNSLVRIAQNARADYVIHLAAQSFVGESFKNARATFETNFFGTLNLLEALATTGFRGRFLYVGSADIYGAVPAEALPITEVYCPRPRNPYAVSKLAAEALCYQWSQTGPFNVVIARPFNHVGPGQSENFAISGFARQLAEVKLGRRPPRLEVGNVDVTRDFTDVRDVCLAYLSLMREGENGESYNVCSGVEYSVRDMIERLQGVAGVKVDVVQDATRVRPEEQRRVCGSYEKLNVRTNWRPHIPLHTSLRDILSDWEERIKNATTA